MTLQATTQAADLLVSAESDRLMREIMDFVHACQKDPMAACGAKYKQLEGVISAALVANAPAVDPLSKSVEVSALIAAVHDWSADRSVKDWGEADLMKAMATLDGDWPGCEGCDHECDEHCMPSTVAEFHRAIDEAIAQLVHDGQLARYNGYEPPAGWTPSTPRHRKIPIHAAPASNVTQDERAAMNASLAAISGYSIPTSDKRFADEIQVQRTSRTDGPALWAVRLNGDCLNKSGQWEWEPLPSSRDDAFLDRCRFDSHSAAILAALRAVQKA